MTCDKTAVALLTFAPQDAKAWLYDLDRPDPTGGIMLCRKHANATVVPMSWQLIDSRDPAWPGPAGSQPVLQAMAAASVEELMPAVELAPALDLPSDTTAIDEEFAALHEDLPITPQRYAEPQMATARAAGDRDHSTPDLVLVDLGASATPDPSLFELPLTDTPAVTPHPGY